VSDRQAAAGGRPEVADETVVRMWYAEHGRALLAYATRLTGDRAAAADAVQETLVQAWRHPQVPGNGTGSGSGSGRGRLLTVARSIATDRVRARSARPREVAETAVEAAGPPDVERHVVDSMVVMDAMEALNTEQRDVIDRLYFRRQTVAETAAELGIPTGTVKSCTYYALRVLREHLGTAALR
jgi:RNA polymerase sigma-70 factor, ECF subfamily